MYLLKHFTLLLLPASVSDLHSTMYLLKPIKSKFNDINIVDLHSTMYLLKLINPPAPAIALIFTFHYVSIKTRGLK